jgi:molybdopterin-binding protein
MIIAGLVAPDWGKVSFGERVLCDTVSGIHLPAEKRNIGVVFQDYALFPHLTAYENVAYGLKNKGVKGQQLRKKVLGALEMVGISHLADRKPSRLSGGERQRLALARATVLDSPLMLLDEPVSALDPHTRDSVRRELKALINSLGKTTVIVTHDPIDALTLGQRICVLENGKVQQTGEMMELLLYPKTEFVARFMGSNFFLGRLVNVNGDGVREINVNGSRILTVDDVEGETTLSFLPSDVTLSLTAPVGSSWNVFRGAVEDIVHLGDRVRVSVRSQVPIVAEVTQHSFVSLGLVEGQAVYASFKATAVRAGGER